MFEVLEKPNLQTVAILLHKKCVHRVLRSKSIKWLHQSINLNRICKHY